MCGIAGFIDFRKASQKEELVAMTDTLQHRGPDGAGYELWPTEQATIGFGHRRLSIIDLSEAGAQPMQKHGLAITFNGEIYNYREVKKELAQAGFSFASDSDTEVLLTAFHHWGKDCVHRFRGMFACAIFDRKKQEIHLLRDRCGVKPLFLYQHAGLLLFASELKAFHAHPHFDKSLDQGSIGLYFKYGFVPSPKCIFRYVEKVKPGHWVTIDLSSQERRVQAYWSANSVLQNAKIFQASDQEVAAETEKILQESFDYRMVADVPVGVFLSGGYDSSLVTALLQKDRTERINTFTIGFADRAYNEADHATKVASYLGTNHTSYQCTEKEAQEIIPDLPFYYDEPFADSSAIPTSLVSKITAQSVKVALSADGGDELFSGYSRNLRFKSIHQKVARLPALLRHLGAATLKSPAKFYAASNVDKSVWYSKVAKILKDSSLLNVFDQYPQFTSDNTLENILGNPVLNDENPQDELRRELENVPDQFNALLAFDFQSTLTNDMLVKVDRATMAYGLEGREPMLDHHLFEFLARVPSAQKMRDGKLKAILKNITHQHLPPEIMDRPKMGFGVPVNDWLQNDLKYLVDEYLSETAIRKFGILRPEPTLKIVKRLQQNKGRVNNHLWLLLNFQMWCDRWL